MAENPRVADHPINRIFLDRWSPRAFTDEAIDEATLMRFFEAARWAPSSSNVQPWHYVYALRGGPGWDAIYDGLSSTPKRWVHRAAAIVVCASKRMMMVGEQEVLSPTHAFDAGAAWMSFALQAAMEGWSTHGIAGFDHAKVRAAIKAPEGYTLFAVVAVGRRGDPAMLDEDLRKLEFAKGRRPVGDSVSVGTFPEEGAEKAKVG
jgi:nitroreductase